MDLLSQITIPRPEGNAVIQLLHGDLTAIPPEFAVDILVISAHRSEYRTNHETLMTALFKAGISVADLAQHKEVDLVSQLSCWLSQPLPEVQQARLNFRKILCFEQVGTLQDVQMQVNNLFRGINTFALDDEHDDIAMPVLTTGDWKFPIEEMLPALLDTALFWLESGLPLKSLKVVLHHPDQVATGLPIFEIVRQQYTLKQSAERGQISIRKALSIIATLNGVMPQPVRLPKLELALEELQQQEKSQTRDLELYDPQSSPEPVDFDYFISYSHKHGPAVLEFVRALQAHNPQFRIFYDRDTIPPGGLWLKMISDAIQHSKNVVCILTPEYSKSDVCWDEFQCAYIMEKRKKLMIRTINFYNDDDLPPIIAIRSYIDCTEGNLEKLKEAVTALATV